MKKFLSLMLAALLAVVFSGCHSSCPFCKSAAEVPAEADMIAADMETGAAPGVPGNAPRMGRAYAAKAMTMGIMNDGMMQAKFETPEGRQMAFTAHIQLKVGDLREAVGSARKLAQKFGGYAKHVDNSSLVLAIPLPKAEEFLAELAQSGVVTSLAIDGEDVTEQVTDIEIRIANLTKSRERLLALLEKSPKVDELLKVERELTRVTTELERIEAQQKNLKSRINYVTVYVNFVRAEAETAPNKPASPVSWVNELGENLLNRVETQSRRIEAPLFEVALPQGFVLINRNMAISGNGCRIEMRNIPNFATDVHWYGNQYADLAFYEPLIQKSLATRFSGSAATAKRQIGGCDAVLFTVNPVIGKTAYTYCAAVAVQGKWVKLITVSAPREVFEKDLTDSELGKFLDSVRY